MNEFIKYVLDVYKLFNKRYLRKRFSQPRCKEMLKFYVLQIKTSAFYYNTTTTSACRIGKFEDFWRGLHLQ